MKKIHIKIPYNISKKTICIIVVILSLIILSVVFLVEGFKVYKSNEYSSAKLSKLVYESIVHNLSDKKDELQNKNKNNPFSEVMSRTIDGSYNSVANSMTSSIDNATNRITKLEKKAITDFIISGISFISFICLTFFIMKKKHYSLKMILSKFKNSITER